MGKKYLRLNGRAYKKQDLSVFSTGTKVKSQAQQLHDNFKNELWRQTSLPTLPQKYWMDAVIRWLDESKHKQSLGDDKIHLRWADPFLRNTLLTDITQDDIEAVAKAREETGVSPTTVNRMLEIIRAIFRKAHSEWSWLHMTPPIRMRKIDDRRLRWLTHAESEHLLNELPPHLQDMMQFSLATGLRESNVTGLKWADVDLDRKHALVHTDQSKTKKAIPVPLNRHAIEILRHQKGKNSTFVFTYKGNPVIRCNNHAWRKALIRAGLDGFRWHDLRHTWASWHVQNGTSLQELQ